MALLQEHITIVMSTEAFYLLVCFIVPKKMLANWNMRGYALPLALVLLLMAIFL